MSNKKQSSIEWLDSQFASLYFDYLTGFEDNKNFNERHKLIIEQAKSIHKEEIEEAFWNGSDGLETNTDIRKIAEQYYNETYNDAKK